MIISFSVRNFRSIKEKIILSFEPENSKNLEDYYIIEPAPGVRLLKLGLIYGANGSGKTTILKALDFLRSLIIDPAEKKIDQLSFKPFLFDKNTPFENSNFELEFVHENVKYRYEIEFNQTAIISEKLYFYSPNKALVYERGTDQNLQLSTVQFGGKIKINRAHKSVLEANTLWNTTVLAGFLKTNFESLELKSVVAWFKDILQNLVTPKSNLMRLITDKLEREEIQKGHILLLLKAADFKINDIVFDKKQGSLEQFRNEIFEFAVDDESGAKFTTTKLGDLVERTELLFQHSVTVNGKDVSYSLPYIDESQGTQRYYQFGGLLALMINSRTIFPIDELESSLHPDLLRHFLLMFLVNSKQSQLIATTHHRELLMDRDILRDDIIWFTEKKGDGSMDLYALSDFDSSIVRDTTSVYNAYKTGKLGAVPELGDYYLDFTDGEK